MLRRDPWEFSKWSLPLLFMAALFMLVGEIIAKSELIHKTAFRIAPGLKARSLDKLNYAEIIEISAAHFKVRYRENEDAARINRG